MTQLATAPLVPPSSVPDPGVTVPGWGTRVLSVDRLVGSMTTLLAVMLFAFVAQMVLIGPIQQVRAQNVLYKDFRSQLANGVAPTGQLGAAKKEDGGYVLDDNTLVTIGAPVALMTIPDIGVKEVVVQGTTSRVLMNGPGHRQDTPLPGQAGTVVIFGRQATYGGPFRHISTLRRGAEIAFTTGQGDMLYKVTGIRRAGDPAPVADAGAARLTLMTGDGTPYMPSGIVRVDAELVTTKVPASTRPLTASALESNEGPMSSDRNVVLPLLLWSQLLLLLAVVLAGVRVVWGRWQSWIVSVPILGFVGFHVAGLLAGLLPNLI